jgi:hypothetical protein
LPSGVYYFSAIIIVSIATAMSVASLNLYHHGKYHIHPVPNWLSRLFFIIIPKLLFMNIDLPIRLRKRRMEYNPLQNGRIVSNEGRLSIPLILRSCPPKPNENTRLKFSFEYIHRLIEQNERRCEQQEHNTIIGQEWQILGRVIDRLFVLIFLIGTMLVFGFIFSQAPHLRLK